MCGYFCISYFCTFLHIEYILKGKILSDYVYVFSPNEYGKNDKIILSNFNKIMSNFKTNLIQENMSLNFRLNR